MLYIGGDIWNAYEGLIQLVLRVGGVGRLNCSLKVLISGTWEYVTSQGKRDSEDVIILRILRWGDYPGLSG